MRVYARDSTVTPSRYYRLALTLTQAKRWNNGIMVSIGLIVGEYGFTKRSLARLIKAGQAKAVDFDEWNHSGCQSSCVRRGGVHCSW